MELDKNWGRPLMIPCITSISINHLYGTADERYNFSKEFFRKTHYSQSLNRYYKNKLMESVSEDALLEELLEEHTFGNRVYIIFGSTGSGKSELLCWIRDQWILKGNPRPIIRISRNELNPQVLVKKCYESIGLTLEDIIIDENKWSLLLNKPITIINQLVWSTMSELFDRDDEIVPAALLLRPVIEKNIISFTDQLDKGTINTPLEVISKKEFNLLIESTTLNIDINYYKFRDSLLKKLDQFLFNGTDMKTIFRQLSETLVRKKIRPVLLIDDLVQSINLYASDMMDFFITLEDGNWDVVIGLTPGVEQGEDFNSELKNRIKNLDTIDDRVKKLWLSDEAGSNFYSLDIDQSDQYLRKYLLALKDANGYKCSIQCPHAMSCKQLLNESSDNLETLPLNTHLIKRIYKGIPKGKGTLRYLILHSREILRFLISGNSKSMKKIQNIINRDVFTNHEDILIKLFAEMYAHPNASEITISSSFLRHFKYEEKEVTVNIRNISLNVIEIVEDKRNDKDHVKNAHIRDWIEGKSVNEQLLDPVRSGVATIVHEIVKATLIARDDTSRAVKSSATIQRSEIVNRHKYPISLEKNKTDHISIEKDINLLHIANFQQLKPQDRSSIFSRISEEQNVSEWIFQTELLKRKWIDELELHLGYPVMQFVYHLKVFMTKVYSIGQSGWINSLENPIKKEWLEITEELFLDWYSLRDNIIDYDQLDSITDGVDFAEKFLTFKPSNQLNKYKIRSYPLKTFIQEVQIAVNNYIDCLIPIAISKANEIIGLSMAIEYLSSEAANKIGDVRGILQKEVFLFDDIILIEELVIMITREENKELIEQIQNEQSYISNINKLFPNIGNNEIRRSKMEVDNFLRNELKLRSHLRKHVMNLMEKGETQLPRKQWRGILRDFESINPDFFENISITVNIK